MKHPHILSAVLVCGATRLFALDAPVAPSPPNFMVTLQDKVLIRWDDRSDNEESFTLNVTLAGYPQEAAVLPANRNWYILEGYGGSSISGTVTASNAAGSSTGFRDGIYDPSYNHVDAYAEWRFAHWGSLVDAGVAASFADPDADGHPNVLEFSLGSDPLDARSHPVVMAAVSGTGTFGIQFAVNSSALVELTAEFSDDLGGPWRSVVVSPAAGSVMVTDPAQSSNGRGFARVCARLLP